ncbi:MAG: right-handed parallel beta-helix repeat-containing protein, partial [Candidatus Kariarchaeaceae archaeon]
YSDNSSYDDVTIDHCTISDAHTYGVYVSGLANPIISNNDFKIESTLYGAYNSTTNVINAEHNYWNGTLGPQHSSNAEGNGCKVSDNVDFIPFATEPINSVIIPHSTIISSITGGPDNQGLNIPSNGIGYVYYYITSNTNPIYYPGNFTLRINRPDGQSINTEGYFLTDGVLRVAISSIILANSTENFQLEDSLQFGNNLYIIENAIPEFTITKVPIEYNRTFDIFAGGSAGASGSIGSVGVGASISAAKLSVKGSGGGGLRLTIDQDQKILFDRRFEFSIGASIEVPSINPGISGIVDFQAGLHTEVVTKSILGQSFSFSDLSISDEQKRMAQSGFLLETMSLGASGLSPIAGLFIRAGVNTLNDLGGVSQTFEEAMV